MTDAQEGTQARRDWADGGPPAERGAPAALPCLNSNISTDGLPESVVEGLHRLSTNHRKTAFKLAKSVGRLCGRYGIERVGFLTLSFPDHVTCAKEAGKRFNSLRAHVLAHRYVESICVLERMKSGRIHFHLLVVLPVDIRTGFDFEAAARGEYRSANAHLRGEWSFWRSITNYDGRHGHHAYAIFGRTELLPVKSNEDGIAKYVGKYIAKHVGARETRDKGVRLVRYSHGASIGSNAFMFASPRSRLWREQVKIWATRNGCVDLDAVRAKFGHRWAYFHRSAIMAIEPPSVVVGERNGETVTLYDVWYADRLATAAAVAQSGVCTQAEAFTALFTELPRELAFAVPRWSGVNLARAAAEAEWERTIVWADGNVTKL